MPRDGSGGYLPPQNSWNPAINGAQALPNDWQAILNDIATTLQASLAADGQTPVTGIMNFQNNRISNVGAPLGAGDVLRFNQMQKGPDIPSATTIAIPIEGNLFDVTGTTTITGISDRFPGRVAILRFTDALTLTHSSTFMMPGGISIVTRAGDVGIFVNQASGSWICAFYSGAHDVQASSLNGGPLAGMRNKLINGGFRVNQGDVSGTVTLAAGVYGHDQWKAGASGCTYTFATTANVTTLTISAGSLMQVVEGVNLQSGQHVLSWQGTAQGRIDGGTYGTSGVLGTAVGGTNQTVEFNTGTLSFVQYEPGAIGTPFEQRFYDQELSLCRRYYFRQTGSSSYVGIAQAISGLTVIVQVPLPVPMRTIPTIQASGIQAIAASGSAVVVNTVSDNGSSTRLFAASLGMASSSFVAGNAALVGFVSGGGVIIASARL